MSMIERAANYYAKEKRIYKQIHNGKFDLKDLMLSRIRKNPKQYDECVVNGIHLTIRSNTTDYKILDEVVLHDCYKLHALRKKKIPITTVIDIGSFIGDFACFAKKEYPKSRVIAIEPEEENFSLLEKNIADNKMDIQTYKKAITSQKEQNQLVVEKKNKGGHAIAETKSKQTGIAIKTIAFNKLMEKEKLKGCDLLKVDCEGGEYDLFASKENAPYLKATKLITMEYHISKQYPEHEFATKLRRQLQSLGFDFSMKKTNKEVGMIHAWQRSQFKRNPFIR